jgi:transposase
MTRPIAREIVEMRLKTTNIFRSTDAGDHRRVLSGIVHALRCGGRWADCADVYRPKKTLYNRFVRWSERGIWDGISARWRELAMRRTG